MYGHLAVWMLKMSSVVGGWKHGERWCGIGLGHASMLSNTGDFKIGVFHQVTFCIGSAEELNGICGLGFLQHFSLP